MLDAADVKLIKTIVEEAVEKSVNNKIQSLQQSLQQSINTALEPIREDIKEMKKDIANLYDIVRSQHKAITHLADEFKGYTGNDATGIEKEISKCAKTYLQKKFQGFQIIPYEPKHVSSLYNTITEFDGAFLLLNTIPSQQKHKPETNTYFATDTRSSNRKQVATAIRDSGKIVQKGDNFEPIKHLVIIEAKHHVSVQKINKKVEQIYEIRKWANEERAKDEQSWSSGRANKRTLDGIQDIFLFIGGPDWEQGAVAHLNDICEGNVQTIKTNKKLDTFTETEQRETLAYIRDKVAYIVPNGTRYSVVDNTHQIPESQQSGGRIDMTFPMEVLPNYLGTVFT